MTVYMLRNNETGLYYRRMKGYGTRWVEQQKASIWTVKSGPAQSKSLIQRRRRRKPLNLEIVSFTLTENTP